MLINLSEDVAQFFIPSALYWERGQTSGRGSNKEEVQTTNWRCEIKVNKQAFSKTFYSAHVDLPNFSMFITQFLNRKTIERQNSL